jgi:hypothetical protein
MAIRCVKCVESEGWLIGPTTQGTKAIRCDHRDEPERQFRCWWDDNGEDDVLVDGI